MASASSDREALRLVGMALDLPENQQDAWLAREIGGDASLLSAARRLLVATRAAATNPSFLGERAHAYAAPVVARVEAERRPIDAILPAIEAALASRYKFVGEIGRGGAAIVYRAHELATERDVAIKLIRPDGTDKHGRARMLREISMLAELQHPGIVPLLGSGEAEDVLYCVVPYFADGSLRQRLDRERTLPISIALSTVRDVAAGLDYAHARSILHRDIKPQNILLNGENALLADFGLALALDQDGPRLTTAAVIVGTPSYMSPEQTLGARSIDHRSDIYSLGCVLFEMLAGEPPYTAPWAMGIVAQHFRAPVPDLSLLRPEVPPRLSAAVARALAKHPSGRYSSAAEFVRALDAGVASG